MNALDYALIAVLVGFFIYGYIKGLLRQILVALAVGGSFFLAAKYHYELAAADFAGGIRERSESVALVAAFVGILFASAAITSVLASLVARRLESESLASGNRWLGGLVSMIVGVILLGGAAVGLEEWQVPEGVIGRIPDSTQKKAKGLVSESVIVPYLSTACLAIVDWIPQESADELAEIYRQHAGTAPTSGGVASGLANSLTDAGDRAVQEEATTARTKRTSGRFLNLGAQRRLTLESEKAAKTAPASAEGAVKEAEEKTAAPSAPDDSSQ